MILKKTLLIICIMLASFSLLSCSKKEEETSDIYETSADLNGHTLGMIVSSATEPYIKELFPDSQILYFNNASDIALALKDGKIDGTVNDEAIIIDTCRENEELTYFADPVFSLDYAFGFTKNERGMQLEQEVSEYISKCFNDGTMGDFINKWFNAECEEIIPYEELENINGEFIIASDITCKPFSFLCDGQITGFDIDFFYHFAKEYGYSFSIDTYDFSGMITAVTTGKADVVGSSVMYTQERAKNLYFSNAYMQGNLTMMVRKENIKAGYNTFLDLKGKTIGSLEGSVTNFYIDNCIEDAKFVYFPSNSDAIVALESGKVDCADMYMVQSEDIFASHPSLKVIGKIYTEHYAYALPKNGDEQLLEEINEYISKIKKDGTLETLQDLWQNHADQASVDYDSLIDNEKIITLGVCSTIGKPFVYIYNNQYAGLEVDILAHFAKEYGYNIEIKDYTFASLLSDVSLGKVDVACASITITEERRKNVNFSYTYFSGDCVIVVSDNNNATGEETDLFSSIKNKFISTFVSEDRYMLYLDGIVSTLSITIFSAILGTILGFILFLAFRLNNNIMNKLLAFYSWLITGMPTVVFLMIFFYIVFGKSSASGATVAIICFTILFSVTILGLLKTCFSAIDKGQFEAAYALGYSKIDTFFKIIIPQILPMFLPNYLSSLIELMKSSSIVGYIAVQDLTKAADIIRSRTYDAFFPLIATTIIYFLIGALFKLLINILENKTNPKKRKSISLLEGLDQHD